MELARYPPTARTRSVRNRPNAPEIIVSMFPCAQASLPIRNARRYSMTWITSILFAHFLECAILRSIVDDDDLEFRVIQLQEIAYCHADGAFFVMRGGYDRDGRRHGRLIDPAQAMALQTALMRRAGLQGNHQHQQISEIAGQVIPEERVVRDVQKSNHGSNAALSGEPSLAAVSPAGRVPVRSTFCRRSLTSSLISVLL